MSGANAGRTTAGAAGIVSAFVLAQIFMCRLFLTLPECLPEPLPRPLDIIHGVTRGGWRGGAK